MSKVELNVVRVIWIGLFIAIFGLLGHRTFNDSETTASNVKIKATAHTLAE